ncbi:MAG: hypothetical protein QM796_22395 [Chthoniobacteraceae bacterium]
MNINELNELCARTIFEGVPLNRWLRRPEAHWSDLPESLRGHYPAEVWELVEVDYKYEGYIKRQEDAVHRAQAMENKPIPADLNYEMVPDLRTEARQKLGKVRPATFAQAGRISGITPADLGLISIWIRKRAGGQPGVESADLA